MWPSTYLPPSKALSTTGWVHRDLVGLDLLVSLPPHVGHTMNPPQFFSWLCFFCPLLSCAVSHHLRKEHLFNAAFKTFTHIVKLLLHSQKWGNCWKCVRKLGNRLWNIVLMLRSESTGCWREWAFIDVEPVWGRKVYGGRELFLFRATAGKLHFNFLLFIISGIRHCLEIPPNLTIAESNKQKKLCRSFLCLYCVTAYVWRMISASQVWNGIPITGSDWRMMLSLSFSE